MIIDRDKHNKYVAGWKPNYTVPTNQGSSSGTNVTIVYGGGGSGSSTPVSSEAFSYYKVSDGENAITQEAKVQKDIANLSIIGDEGIKVELITDPTIFEASFTSTGINEGVYKISYGKVTTVVEQPTKPETQAEEPIEPEVVITFPMTITYVSGEKIKAEQFDTLRLLNDTEEVATYPSSGLAIEGDADGILSISLEVYKEVQSVDEEGKPVQDAEGNPVMEKQGLYFNKILLTSQLEDQPSTQAEGDSTEEEPQQPTYESLLLFDVVVNIDTVIKLSSDSGAGLWKLDDNGNIYTEYNAYSLKELSAYGPGEGEAGEGVGFLHELGDVSIPAPNEIPDNAILQYNIETGKWEAVELELPEDSATREWVEQKFKDLINGAPADLDTLGEIAIAIQELQQLLDWFSFVDGRIRANYDFWGVGEVSAYGSASGSDPGTGGAGYLYELGDVTINNDTLANGQIIVWDEDSQTWVNVDFSGLDESALALYLTQNKYATQGWVNGQLAPINIKLEEFQTTIDMINDMFEWDNGRIKAKATLYSVGEISAYGAGGGSSGTSGYLHELDDVLLTDLQNDQLLMYDASIGKWINVDKNSVGLNETELEQYLTTHNYVTSDRAVSPTRRIIAGTGLTGGGSLSADVTLSLATSGVTVGTYTKVTVDRYGRVTVGALLVEDDIPDIAWSKIHSTPTTLAGYGITDAYTMQQSDERYVNVIGDIMTGNLILPTLQANTSIILGSVKLEYDSANNALKISNVNTQQAINLYATGEISAYGYNSGSADSGVSILDDLDDVTISSPQNGQVLMYNGSQWVNSTLDVGLDETALAQYLTSHLYATQSWVNSQNYATEADLDARIDALVNGAPAAFDTLKEIADVLQGNVDSIGDILTALGNKADKTITITAGTGLTGGGNLSANRTLSLATVGTAGTYTKVTVDAYGRVTGHASLAVGDIPNLPWSKITSGKPTTLAGYGITDAYTKTEADGRYVNVSGDTMTGNLTLKPLGGSWLNGKTQAPIMTNGASSTTGSTYHPIIWGKTTAGDVWNLGHGASDQVGFFGFYSERTANGTDWSTYIKVSTGVFYQSKDMNVTGLITATAGLTTPQYIQIGSGRIKWDSSNNALYVEKSDGTAIGFYSKGFISAKGANDGAGGTVSGATALSQLSDVQLGTLATNQVLSWNGSKWVNKAISTGLDETALAQYLTNNQYLTMPTGDGRYVTLATAQTISGKKTFTAQPTIVGSGLSWSKRMNTNTSNYEDAILWLDTSLTKIARIGYHNTVQRIIINPIASDEPWADAVGKYSLFIGNNLLTYNTWPILHSGNYTSIIGNSFVKKAGDTMTGALTVPSLAVSGSTATVSGNKVWHAGNDGSGSGLDADLLDGLHLSGIRSYGYAMQQITIDASGLDQNTWYPVTINISVNHQVLIAVIVSLDSGTKPSWSTHQNGFSVRKIWYTNGSGWGTNPVNKTVLFSDYSFTSTDPVRGLGQLTNSNNEYVYVRGGGKYYFYISHGRTPVLHTSTYTVTKQSVSPTTTMPAAISRTNALITDNVYSATQLQTARTINGTAFNGTSNIVTSYWGTARTLSLTGNATGSVSMNGSSNVSMSVNVNYATSAGNASTLGGTSKAGLFTALSSSNATNLSVTIGGTTKSITDLYANYATSAGNADTLDGYHGSSYLRSFWTNKPGYDANTYPSNSFCTFTYSRNAPYTGVLAYLGANGYGMYLNLAYSTGTSTGQIAYRKVSPSNDGGGLGGWAYLARTTDNVYSATKLQTARTIWGQSFNGTANVSGNMTGVGSISASGNITAPSFYASNWFRTTGQTGWYSETYGGGIYMSDSTWVRLYNGKYFYAGNGIIRTDYLFDRQGYVGNSWNNGYGAYNVAITNNSSQTPLLVAYRSGQSQAVTGANRLFSMELLNSGSLMYLCFGGGMRYSLTSNGVFYASAGMYSNGYVSALGQNSSDARLKTNIRDFKATSLIRQLHPKSFEWNDLAKSKFEVFRNTGTQYGLIAQDVKEVMPEWVDDNLIGSGYMGIRYDKLIPVLLQGEIETISRVETLEDKVRRLEKENGKLKKRINELERRAS